MTYEREPSGTDAPQPAERASSTDAPKSTSTERVRRDWTRSGRPSTTIVETVAAATDRDPTDLPPLQHYVDADSLDAILTESGSESVTVSFAFDGVGVTAHSDGGVEVAVDGETR